MEWLKNLNPINKLRKDLGKDIGEKLKNTIGEYFTEFRQHFDSIKDNVLSAFQRDHDPIGRVLKCHLILETYMDSCISHLNNDQLSFDNNSLRYIQKVDLLEAKLDGMDSYFKGIRSLNTIRNRFAHNLSYEITLNDIKSMKVYAEIYKRERIEDPIRLIEEFTIVACALLQNETVEKFAGLSKLYAAMAKAMEENPEKYEEYLNSRD